MRKEVKEFIERIRGGEPGILNKLTNFNLTRGEEKALAFSSLSGCRMAMAARKNLSKNLVLKLSLDQEEGVQGLIAGKKALPKRAILNLAGSKSVVVKKMIASRKDLQPQILDILSRDNEETVRQRISEKPELPWSIRGRLVKNPSWEVASYSRKLTDLPMEAAWGLYNSEGTTSQNLGLYNELKSKKEFRGEARNSRDIIDNFYAWRGKFKKEWQCIAERKVLRAGLGPKVNSRTGKIKLPEYADGYFQFFYDATSKAVFVDGKLRGKWGGVLHWQTELKEVPLDLDLPNFEIKYESENFLKAKKNRVELLGQAFANHNLFALWGIDGEPVGWTEEEIFALTPKVRNLDSSDLILPYQEELIKNFCKKFRSMASKAFSL